jgi:outer membrane protein assembly factor BamB
MSEPSRRALLAALGTAALAGCSTDDPPGDTVTDTESTTPTPEPPEPPAEVEADWPAPAHDPGVSNGTVAAGPAEPVAELWRVEADARLSTPVVAGNTLYVGGTNGVVHAVDARTGEQRWEATVGEPLGTPWVVDGRLFVPTNAAIVAFSLDGSEQWRVETPDRTALLATGDGVYWLADREPPVVVALERADGSERWRAELGDPWEPPLFAGAGRVLVSSGTHDYRFWRLDPATGDLLNDAPRSGHDFPEEQFARDGTVYAADPFFGNVETTPLDGSDGWSRGVAHSGKGSGGLLTGDGERVYYTSNADGEPNVFALSAGDGAVAWTATLDGVVTGRPVAAADAVLVPTDAGAVCLDPDDGTVLWTRPAGFGGRFVVADDLVFAASDRGVTAFRPP